MNYLGCSPWGMQVTIASHLISSRIISSTSGLCFVCEKSQVLAHILWDIRRYRGLPGISQLDQLDHDSVFSRQVLVSQLSWRTQEWMFDFSIPIWMKIRCVGWKVTPQKIDALMCEREGQLKIVTMFVLKELSIWSQVFVSVPTPHIVTTGCWNVQS